MEIRDIYARLGKIDNLEIARASVSKTEALFQIVEYINNQGVDVDDKYLSFLSSLDYASVNLDIKYIPVYKTTTIARLTWKEKSENSQLDHQEYVRFNSVFYANQNNKKDRINKLNILDSIDKQAIKINESKVENIESISSNQLMVIDENKFVPQIIMGKAIEDGEYYSLDQNYVMAQSEIERIVEKDLEKTKSYKRLSKESEKWSKIEQISIAVVLVPVASIFIGNHVQLVNTVNGKIDVIYEQSKHISSKLIKARWISYPSVILFAILMGAILALFCLYKTGESIFLIDKIWHPFTNFNGWIFLICVILGLFFTILGLPTRKSIVKRETNNKNPISKSKSFSLLLYSIDFGLLILLLTILQYIIGTTN